MLQVRVDVAVVVVDASTQANLELAAWIAERARDLDATVVSVGAVTPADSRAMPDAWHDAMRALERHAAVFAIPEGVPERPPNTPTWFGADLERFAPHDGHALLAAMAVLFPLGEYSMIGYAFEDVQLVFGAGGSAYYGVGVARGEGRATTAVNQAVSGLSTWLAERGPPWGVEITFLATADVRLREISIAARSVSDVLLGGCHFVFSMITETRAEGSVLALVRATWRDQESIM